MDKEALKKSVTLNLRCVTQSCKGGVPLNNLQNDYKGLIGTAIPFTELGYKSLETFLQSIPDVVCLKKNKGGQCIVEGVADVSTAHIANLISRQKSTKGVAKKYVAKKPSLPIRKYPCHESWKSSSTNYGGICKQDGKPSALNSANPKVPTLKPLNSGTISSAPRKVASTSQNNVIYGQSNAKINPLGEGTSNTGKLYSSLFTDAKTSIAPPLPSSSSQKQTEIQKMAASHNSEIPNPSKEVISESNLEDDSALSKTQRRKRRKKAKMENNLATASESSLSLLTKSQLKNLRKKNNKAEKLHKTEMFVDMLKENCAPSTMQNTNQVQDSSKTIEVSPTIQKQQLKELTLKNLRSVTLSCKGGVLLTNLQKDYNTLLGIPIPYKELGYGTLEAFIQDIPDVINLKKNKEGHIYAQAVSDVATAQISNLVSKQKQSNTTKSSSQHPLETIPPPVAPRAIAKSVLPSFFQEKPPHSATYCGTSRDSLSNAPMQELKSSSQHPLESIKPPVAPKAITKSVPLSFSQEKPPHSTLPKGFASNIVYKPTLNNFPSIRHSITSAKFSSLLTMNFLLFGDDSYMETLKRGILAFDGFTFSEGSDQWKQKELLLSMLSDDTLRECLKLLCIKCGSDSKIELVNKLLKFLTSPGNGVSVDTIRKEKLDDTGVAFGNFAGDVFENLKQLQACIHNQEYNILNEVGVKGASTSKSANNFENFQVSQSKNVNINPSPAKVVKKKKSNQSVQVSSQESTGAESDQFQKLKNMFSLNPNVNVSEKSTDAASSSSSHKSKSYHCQVNYALLKKKKKKKNAAKSEANS